MRSIDEIDGEIRILVEDVIDEKEGVTGDGFAIWMKPEEFEKMSEKELRALVTKKVAERKKFLERVKGKETGIMKKKSVKAKIEKLKRWSE